MDYITRVYIENYFCIKSLELGLTPLHAFIGPNDSGKSTILRAIRTAVDFARGAFRRENGVWTPCDPAFLDRNRAYGIAIRTNMSELEYSIVAGPNGLSEGLSARQIEAKRLNGISMMASYNATEYHFTDVLLQKQAYLQPALWAYFRRGARFIHPSADALRQPSRLMPGGERTDLSSERGAGLPAIYDEVMNRGDDSIAQIREQVRRLFPKVKSIGLKLVADGTKELQVTLTSGEKVPARDLSEGLLYYLFFAALQHLEPAAVLLVEEPENGLHPARIAEVTRILREISQQTQVLIATHSPLVINELKPEEVSLVTCPPETGTQVRPLSQTANFEERAKFYALGELWLNYANGQDEKELVQGVTP